MLDILDANDYVCLRRLQHNFRKIYLNSHLVDLISSCLSNRVTTIRSNEFISLKLPITYSIPQGSPLSPILYMFYYADLLDKCSNVAPSISANTFINDTTLFAISPSVEQNRSF